MAVARSDRYVIGFGHESDARRFWDAMQDRLKEFALTVREMLRVAGI
jgi:RNA-directed DNA polymerase